METIKSEYANYEQICFRFVESILNNCQIKNERKRNGITTEIMLWFIKLKSIEFCSFSNHCFESFINFAIKCQIFLSSHFCFLTFRLTEVTKFFLANDSCTKAFANFLLDPNCVKAFHVCKFLNVYIPNDCTLVELHKVAKDSANRVFV